ncbi:putative methionyl-tRNA synthetase [Hordeum vulgare]|nr:putative methionyl-tRNA synthetase [Hordeum vulgare]
MHRRRQEQRCQKGRRNPIANSHVKLDLLKTNVTAKKRNTDLAFLMGANTSMMDEQGKAWYFTERDLIFNQMSVPAATGAATATETTPTIPTGTTPTTAIETTPMTQTETTPETTPTTLTETTPTTSPTTPASPAAEEPHYAEPAI